MTFNDNKIWNKPIPRFLGFFVLLLSIGSIFWLSGNVVLFEGKAALGNTPKNVEISNITDNSATISFTTDASVIGSVSYGKDISLGQVGFDTRDAQSPAQHVAHYINLTGLDPGTKYFFSVISGDGIFQKDSVPYELTTASNAGTSLPKSITVKGAITIDGTKAPNEAIAYLKTSDSQLISSLVKPDGKYEFTIQKLLKNDLSGSLELDDKSILTMTINDSVLQSKISFFANLADSIPPIILSKDYDFTIEQVGSSSASESAKIPEFPALPEGETTQSGPQILTPTSNEKFEDQQPLFEGKALPQSDVEITIQSDPITATVQSDQNGNWQFRPNTKLEPGVHKITIKTLNAQGILQTLTRSFTVFAEGSQFTEPSISPASATTPTPTTRPAPSVTAPIATQAPTATVIPTLAPSTQPTAIVIAPTLIISAPVLSPSTVITIPPIPASGSSALILGIIGTILTIGIGGLIFLLI
ncbi:MAG TPA: Ig-like domain-containing protein [Candidatus Limnocylindrales bacterium]|nr:Ig-like domain-containing protein [Candidatus Limnocylindrales bacterium]